MKYYNGKRVTAVILCAGTGARTHLGYNKLLYYIGKKTLLETTLDVFENSVVSDAVLAIRPSDEAAVREIVAAYPFARMVAGGETRTESVRNGLRAASGCDIAVIHDGARPFLTPDLIRRTVDSAIQYGSGIAAVPATDTIREGENGVLTRSLPREKLWCMQTPQTFDYARIRAAYERQTDSVTDDAEVFSRAGYVPRIVRGEYENIKITTAADLFRGAPARTRIGTGFDVHAFTEGRPLIVGGVRIPHTRGLLGHSDADVLTHAITDALLSAAGLPDIGVLFPDTDPATEGIDSLLLLADAAKKIAERGYAVGNVSAVIMAEAPKMAAHIPAMRTKLADCLHVSVEAVNVSATTTERLGIIGEEKGMAASATCLLTY